MKLLILKEGGSFRSGWRAVLEQEKQTHIADVCPWILLADTAGENESFRKASIQPNFFILYKYVGVCVPCEHSTPRGQKRTFDDLELRWYLFVSHHESAGNQTWDVSPLNL